MARPVRLEFEGAVYHVTARGNERRRIFRRDEDQRQFPVTLEQSVAQFGLGLHGFCLMPNHYHLLVETPRGNLSRAAGWLQTTYTIRFNRRYRRSGHLFQGRFKAQLVEADAYAMELIRYVHLNPVRPRDKTAPVPADRREALRDYPWSSHPCYAGRVAPPRWLSTDWLGYFGKTRPVAQRQYQAFVEDAFESAVESPWQKLRLGLVLGGDALFERVRGMAQGKRGAEEMAWVSRVDDCGMRERAARKLASQQSERRWGAWIRVRLGAERRVDVGRSMGYKDGSAITHLLQRLDEQIAKAPHLASRRKALEAEFNRIVSCFKS